MYRRRNLGYCVRIRRLWLYCRLPDVRIVGKKSRPSQITVTYVQHHITRSPYFAPFFEVGSGGSSSPLMSCETLVVSRQASELGEVTSTPPLCIYIRPGIGSQHFDGFRQCTQQSVHLFLHTAVEWLLLVSFRGSISNRLPRRILEE